ncbi:MAG: hypothetical protein WCA84_12330 [Ignavibacteriaceae bacterium]
MKEKVRQLIDNKELNLVYTPRPIDEKTENVVRVSKISDAKRLLSKIIHKLQRGEIKGQDAKDMTYILINFVHILKEGELEAKINNLIKDMNILKSSK